MFFLRSEALALGEERILGLRLSLNTPVVSTETLAVGPARGALVVHLESDGRPNVTIGIRSLRSGEVALYSFEGDLREHSSLAVGIDGALSFAESMGFLFDEDELAASNDEAARERALGLWGDLMGVPLERAPAEDAAPELELLLDEVAEAGAAPVPDEDGTEVEVIAPRDPSDGYVPQFEGDLGGDAEFDFDRAFDADALGVTDPGLPPIEFELSPTSARGGPGPTLDLGAEGVEIGRAPEPAPLSLSKFRGEALPPSREKPGPRAPEATSAPPAAASSARGQRAKLARLKLVRRESDDGRPHPILRLFGSF